MSESVKHAASGLRERLLAPFAAGYGPGCDPRESPLFSDIRAEVARTSGRDWERIASGCLELLARGKDLVLLGYLLQATLACSGWEAAAEVASAYAELVESKWDDLYPRRERARRNAIQWLGEDRTVAGFASVAAGPSELTFLHAAGASLATLEERIARRIPDDPPSLGALRRTLAAKAEALHPAAPPPPPPSSEPQIPSPPPAQEHASPSPSGTGSRTDVLRTLQASALELLEIEPENQIGWRLLRALRWRDLRSAPPSQEGKTRILPPHPRRIAAFEADRSSGAWDAILARSEAAFTEPGMHLWLDLQRCVVMALEGCGRPDCAEAVRDELRALLLRVPSLPQLRFTDGTPFADTATRTFLETLSQEASPPTTSATVHDTDLEQDDRMASELASKGQFREAIELLQAGLPFGDGRSRTLRQLAIARIALSGGKHRTAILVGEELCERCLRMELSSWEPRLASEILGQQLRALSTPDGDGAELPERSLARHRISAHLARFDPALLTRMDT